jgi:hypothetical protein
MNLNDVNNIKIGSGGQFRLHKPLLYNRLYGVVINFVSNEEKVNTVHYKIEISFEGLANNIWHLILKKQQTFINDTAADSQLGQLAEIFAKPLYPLKISMDTDGLFKDLMNYDLIKEHWLAQRQTIVLYYKGPVVEQLLKQADIAYSSKIQLFNALRDDLFYKLYFAPLYVAYDKELRYEYRRKIALLPNKPPVTYEIIQQLQPFYSDDGKLAVNVTGKCADPRSLNEITSGKIMAAGKLNPAKGIMDITYKLYREDHSIYSIDGYINLLTENGSGEAMRVEIQVYDLHPEKMMVSPYEKMLSNVMDIQEVPIKEKRSFWDRLFN